MTREIERRPEKRGTDGAEVQPAAGARVAISEERLVESRATGARISEVLILVLEAQIAIERERPQEREVLHFIRRVDARSHGRQREQGQQPHGEQASFISRRSESASQQPVFGQ